MIDEQSQQEAVRRLEDLLTLNGQAFAAEQYTKAYHLLTAALRTADELCDLAHLQTIEMLAAEQGRWIDLHVPAHRLSTASATERGHPALFRELSTEAHHCQVLLHNKELGNSMPESDAGNAS